MLEFIKVNGQKYPVKSTYNYNDHEWDNRETVLINLTMSYTEVIALLIDNVKWSKGWCEECEMTDHTEEVITEEDMSEYSISGDITDHRDGTISIKMGKPTKIEILESQITGTITETELETAYVEGVNSL